METKKEIFHKEFLNNKEFDKVIESFKKDKYSNLKHISREAKRLKDSLEVQSNPIYRECTSFDDICQVVGDNSNGKLSGDSINSIAAKVAFARDILPDDSCWDSKILSNSLLQSIGLNKDEIDKFISTNTTKQLSKPDWQLFFLTRSRQINRIYKNAEKQSR